jgi:hypothetical protein
LPARLIAREGRAPAGAAAAAILETGISCKERPLVSLRKTQQFRILPGTLPAMRAKVGKIELARNARNAQARPIRLPNLASLC